MEPKLQVDLNIIYEEAACVLEAIESGDEQGIDRHFHIIEQMLDGLYERAGKLSENDYHALRQAKDLIDQIGEILKGETEDAEVQTP